MKKKAVITIIEIEMMNEIGTLKEIMRPEGFLSSNFNLNVA